MVHLYITHDEVPVQAKLCTWPLDEVAALHTMAKQLILPRPALVDGWTHEQIA